MNRLEQKIEIARRLGVRWVAFRAGYALRKRFGMIRSATPAVDLARLELGSLLKPGSLTTDNGVRSLIENRSGRFLFILGEAPTAELLGEIAGRDGVARTIAVADDYCRGRFLYYSRRTIDHGWPVEWLRVPTTGGSHHADVHWSDYPTFSAALGDVKTVWEPSRFACAFWLGRAYAMTRDEKYAKAYWQMFDRWAEQNPPNMGPNWKCGQETSFRAFAWLFALHVFWKSPETTNERLTLLLKLLVISGRRIAANIDFAVSQKNNHGISEAVGLLTLGLMLPFAREADEWQHRGRQVLEREVARQIYDDGSFVQHSMNYHRLMLHDCLWAMQLATVNEKPLSPALRERVTRAAEFLFEMTDPDSGGAPNYGANDGSLILPLDSADYTDYRPIAQAATFATAGHRVFSAGPWDELGTWIFGEPFLQARIQRREPTSRRFDAGGYFTIRSKAAWCMTRCHSYRDRPSHVDMMHVDLWHKGVNVLSDSGSYLYYSPGEPGFEKFFKDVAAHNTIEIGGHGPLELASRFLWVPWPTAKCLEHGTNAFSGESGAYARAPWNVVHRRSIRCVNEKEWIIADELAGAGAQDIVLRWHLADGQFTLHSEQRWVELALKSGRVRLTFEAPREFKLSVARGDESPDHIMGWQSLYYGERTPRPTVELSGRVNLPIKLTTRLSLGGDSNL